MTSTPAQDVGDPRGECARKRGRAAGMDGAGGEGMSRGARWLGVAAAAMLAGCGFRLAGSAPLPVVLAKPYLSVRNPYTDFAREFERQLKSSGAVLQVGREAATATIDVSKDSVEQRTLSVSARNIPTEYELIYTVVYSVHGAAGDLIPPQTIFLSRDYSFNETALLAKDNEADILRAQMARDLVAIAMRRLSKLK